MTTRFRRAIGAVFAIAIASIAFTTPGLAEVDEADRDAIRSIVREYLLENPEVVRDALIELERRDEAAQNAARREAVSSASEHLFNSTRQVELGNPQGDVTLVEFFDYNCGYCRRAMDDVLRLLDEDDNLRVVLKEFPVLGQGSVEAARVAVAVKENAPEKYLEFHKNLLGSRGQANQELALQVAEKIGLNRSDIEATMGSSPEVRATIEEVYSLANRLGLTGTPSFVLGDEVVMGAVGYDTLKQKIAALRDCGSASC
ncbi:thioredoxin domain-containing protein [Stappia sp. GBMRC 2046]|uniref:Thioredoxin domain-containing protein n=1 Tax=Stappia sediminis TaxID=2692190 RepID=A0A7X3LXT8_9HYPH|nr:DsbA family protein [Stappia sediminis]MXN67077.1 thioredoxin domain-containing protein [Stappia sediminis]